MIQLFAFYLFATIVIASAAMVRIISYPFVTPAKAGAQSALAPCATPWVPAFAGMTRVCGFEGVSVTRAA